VTNTGGGSSEAAVQQSVNVSKDRWYSILAWTTFSMLAISDEDPANDRYWQLFARPDVKPLPRLLPKLKTFVQLGFTQKFVAEQGETGFLFQDMAPGATYTHKLEVPLFPGYKRDLAFLHRLYFYLPTSRASINQELYLAPRYFSRVSLAPIDKLSLQLDFDTQYRFHRLPYRKGPGAPLNTRYVIGGVLRGEYTFFALPKWGELTAGLQGETAWSLRYSSSDGHDSPTSDQAPWFQSYGWATYVNYSPITSFIFEVTLNHGGQVLRDGIVNTFLGNRDETELQFTAYFTY
jgi:hypothetical protein